MSKGECLRPRFKAEPGLIDKWSNHVQSLSAGCRVRPCQVFVVIISVDKHQHDILA